MKKIIFLFLAILTVTHLVSSWGPNTHNQMALEILSENTTQFGQLCGATEENRQAFLLGCVTPDITVIYYYEEGGSEYRLSHNWNFQQEITSEAKTEDEICFSYGIAAHLIQDGIAHTRAVPEAINEKLIPNWLIHPLLEKKYDSALVLVYPDLKETTPHMMDALDGPHAERYIEMIENAMGENSKIDVKSELKKLQIAIKGKNFYDDQFAPSGNVFIFKAYPYIDRLTNYLAPFIGTVNYGNIDFYYEKSKEQTKNVFNNWGARYQVSPHGFDELSIADKNASSTVMIVLIISFLLPIAIAYFKRNWLWLILIPLILFGVIFVVYALI